MRIILVLLAVLAVAALLGWVTISWVGDSPSVTVNPDKVGRDAGAAAEATEQVARKAAAEGERLIDEARRTEVDVDVRRESAAGEP